MNHLLLSCIDSRIENNRNLYGCFQLGPFNKGQGITIANAMRRTLLSELSGLSIVCVEIKGVNHEYSNIRGVRESVLDILLNLKKLVFISNNLDTNLEIGFLKIHGPAIVKSCDLKLPLLLKCVDPNQYIATLDNNSSLEIKFLICKGKNFLIQTSFDLITKKFDSYFYFKQKNGSAGLEKLQSNFSEPANLKKHAEHVLLEKKIYINQIKKKNFAYFKQKSTQNLSNLNLNHFNAKVKKSIYDTPKNIILVKLNQKLRKPSHFLHAKRVFAWRKNYFLNKTIFTNFSCERNIQLFQTKLFLKKKKLVQKLQKNYFHNFEKILLYSSLNVSTFQSVRNLIYKQNLRKSISTDILLVDPVFMPVTKVNFSIKNIENFYKIKNKILINKFQKKNITEKIILDICTNGSIDPKNALYKVTQKIIENFIPFQKIYFTKKKNKSLF